MTRIMQFGSGAVLALGVLVFYGIWGRSYRAVESPSEHLPPNTSEPVPHRDENPLKPVSVRTDEVRPPGIREESEVEMKVTNQDIAKILETIISKVILSDVERDDLYNRCAEIWLLREDAAWEAETGNLGSDLDRQELEAQLWREISATNGEYVATAVRIALEKPRRTLNIGRRLFDAVPDLAELDLGKKLVLLSSANAYYTDSEDAWFDTMTGVEGFNQDKLTVSDRAFIGAISRSFSDEELVAIIERIAKLNQFGVVPFSG